MSPRRAAVASRLLALLAAIALAVAGLLFYAGRTVFDSDGFADRAASTLDSAAVRDAAGQRLTGVVLAARPNLVTLQPIIELAARSAVGTPPFRALVRRAALDAHRSAFAEHSRHPAFRIRDAGVVLAAAVRRLWPDAAGRIPTGVVAPVARVAGTVNRSLLRLAERADGARRAKWVAIAAALVFALGAFLVTDSRRASLLRLGASIGVVGAVVALATALGPRIVTGADQEAVRAALAVWLDPVRDAGLAALVGGFVVACAARASARPITLVPAARRLVGAVAASPRSRFGRILRVAAAIGIGAAMVASPRAVLTGAVVVVGALLILGGLAEIVGLAAGPSPPAREDRRRATRRGPRAAAAAAVVVACVVLATVLRDGDAPAAPRVGACNGHAALCARRVDQVAFLGTHNSMAAAGEQGWLFAAQDAGIRQQLDDGVRALLIDTHYAVRTPRGVATELGDQSRAKLVAEVGEQVVATAERVRARIGRNPTGERSVFLCHTFCEVGATAALAALRDVHRFLVMHPEEVVVLSIQDDTSAADTAALIRDSGLVDEVYRGPAERPWPTLRELIDRDERVIVLAENHAGGAPWIHRQPTVAQETPYRFKTVSALAADASCKPNRGGTAGSLLLVNHWVDTSPAPRVTIARSVNAHDFLTRRLDTCRRTRRMLPNIVAVDFYREGDAARVVDELNRAG